MRSIPTQADRPFRLQMVAMLLFATTAAAHPQGFHKKLTFTVSKYAVEGLLVMDVDGGDRCKLLRAGADTNHDGVLTGDEVTALKGRLTAMMTRALKLGISGATLPVTIKEAKLNLHEDPRVGEAGVSAAVLLQIVHPLEVTPGMQFEVTDSAPDLSPLRLEVFQRYEPQAPADAPVREDVDSGVKRVVRLGSLSR